MDGLERFVTRRRRLVLGVWIVLVVAAVPFAAQQTKHLTAGGFEVPGSGSETVSEALKRFPGVQTEPLILVFENSQEGLRCPGGLDRQGHAGGQGDPERGRVTRRPRRRPRPRAISRSCSCRSASPAAPTPRSTRRPTCARTCTSSTTATWRFPSTSWASRRCGPECRTSPRRTSRRPSSPASPSSSSSCSPSSARWRPRCCRSASGWRPSCSRARRSTSSPRRCRCRSS